ncbi:phosphopantetheine-binding protein [[Kitasatospora] papulosa]|uniref:phosphopantetheine-binding protein n=1 Tax=[Kitasatospora] papulosa TaxID=1464011 RepID=UPI0036C21651
MSVQPWADDVAGTALAVVLTAVDEVVGSGPYRPADNFYDIGGSSLDAMRISLRVGRALAVEVPAEELLRSDDLAGFVAWVTAAREAA